MTTSEAVARHAPDDALADPILIVDDQLANVRLLERMLDQAGFSNVRSTLDPLQALALIGEDEPCLLLLDLQMPRLDGFGVMDALRTVVPDTRLFPILVLTADASAETKRRALASGAHDFLAKPFDAVEVVLRIKNLLTIRRLHHTLQRQNQTLEQRVDERTRELDEARLETLERLARAAEFRDDQTGAHTQRVARVSAEIARASGLDDAEVRLISQAAPLHDVGKIGVSDLILLKPGKLTDEEFRAMQLHAEIGARILSGSSSATLKRAEEIALSHHERWDGRGYPHGLAGEAIPLAGRIVAIADVFDALTHERPYKPAWPVEGALREIEANSGAQFDPRLVSLFLTSTDLDSHRITDEQYR